ncbi:hypothetical protein C8Q76DRAFT_361654 [Earliella scabrosa]|nr:hypothetical protein C8Q76DRAFT_361654 [Earliella scabrosa]
MDEYDLVGKITKVNNAEDAIRARGLLILTSFRTRTAIPTCSLVKRASPVSSTRSRTRPGCELLDFIALISHPKGNVPTLTRLLATRHGVVNSIVDNVFNAIKNDRRRLFRAAVPSRVLAKLLCHPRE